MVTPAWKGQPIPAEKARRPNAAPQVAGSASPGYKASEPPAVAAPLVERLRAQIDLLLAHCPDAECHECGKIICPHGEPLHFHHDGCPACDSKAVVDGHDVKTFSTKEK